MIRRLWHRFLDWRGARVARALGEEAERAASEGWDEWAKAGSTRAPAWSQNYVAREPGAQQATPESFPGQAQLLNAMAEVWPYGRTYMVCTCSDSWSEHGVTIRASNGCEVHSFSPGGAK